MLVRTTLAAHAGPGRVGKQTIYRWWPSKGAVVLGAFERVAAEIPVPNTGDVLADMRTFLTGVVTLFTDDNFGPHLGALIGEAQHDPAVRTALLEQYLKPRRRSRRPPQARPAAPAAPPELDLTAVLAVMFGAQYHRLLLRNGPLDQAYAHFAADIILGGCSASQSQTAATTR